MVTISEVLALKNFYNFRLIAGAGGINRPVIKGGFIDTETADEMRETAIKHEMIFSNLPMIINEPEKLIDLVQALIDTDTACLAIKTKLFKEVPEEAIVLADKFNFPIFLFEDTFIEYLILDIDDLVNKHKQIAKKVSIIKEIESMEHAPYMVRNKAYELNKYFKNYMGCCMVKGKSENVMSLDSATLLKILGQSSTIIPMENSYYFLISKDEPFDTETILDMLKLDDYYHIGVSEVFDDLSRLNEALLQSQNALKYACFKDKDRVFHHTIGIYQMLFSIMDQPAVTIYYQTVIQELIHYDQKHQSDLLSTAVVFVENNGDVKKTAENLYQHINTIRYRIRKIKQILKMDDLDGMAYETLAMAIHLYQLNLNRDTYSLL